jgi:predicted metal-dependent HD superfamily phosphohydrolase
MREQLRTRWLALAASLGVEVAPAERVFRSLLERYNSPDRHYHNLRHLGEVLALVDELLPLAANPQTVLLAAWFHDAIYDSRAADNEQRSSDLAEEYLRDWPSSGSWLGHVRNLILLTRTHQPPIGDHDALILLDADLGILGAAPERYREYADGIRREYGWVPEERYRQGRGDVLRRFLERSRIYQTELMFTAREAQARENIAAEIAALSP